MGSPDESRDLGIIPTTGLLGHNIGYSLSPMLHVAAGEASGRQCDYNLFDIPPEHLDGFLRRVVQFQETLGFNVTTPYKEDVASRFDALHDSAREVGAVNVVALRGDHLIGYNTDRPALASSLRAAIKDGGHPDSGWTVVLLGAGGGARAACWALLDTGLVENLIVSARDPDRIHSIKNDTYFAFTQAQATFSTQKWMDWGTLFVESPAMLINATPLGSADNRGRVPHSSPHPPQRVLKQFSLVLDIVYAPPVTGLMKAARSAGVEAVGGGGMLVEQAVLSRSIWFGEGEEDIERAAMVAAYSSWASKSAAWED